MGAHLDFDVVKRTIGIPEILEHFRIPHTVRNNRISMVCPLPSHIHNSVTGGNRSQWQADFKADRGYWLYRCWAPECNGSGTSVQLAKELALLTEFRHVREWFLKHFPHVANGQPPDNERSNGNGTKKSREEITGQSNSPRDVTESPVVVADPELVNKSLKPQFNLSLDPEVPYLRERNVNADTIERYGLGLCRRSRMFAGYVCAPVHRWPQESLDERAIGYVGRWAGEDHDETDGRPRYKIGVEASQVVYGLKQALSATSASAPLILVEGIFKVFHLAQSGFPNTVSPLTASVSEEQARLLALTGRPIVVVFDGDEAGRIGTRRAIAQLSLQTYARRVLLPDDTEPDEIAAEAFSSLLLFARP